MTMISIPPASTPTNGAPLATAANVVGPAQPDNAQQVKILFLREQDRKQTPPRIVFLPDLGVLGRPDLTRLKEELLRHGGTRFQDDVVLFEQLGPDLTAKLLKQGHVFAGEEAQMHPMIPEECHSNALLLAARAGAEWWMGLALGHDDVWRIHSWAVRRGQLLETTAAREKYFGVKVRVSDFTEHVVDNQARMIELGNEMRRVMDMLTQSQSIQVIDHVIATARTEEREATTYDFVVAAKAVLT
jgi:hypothetical protein